MIAVAQTPSTSKSPWTVIRSPASIAARSCATIAVHRVERRRRVRLVGGEEGARLLRRAVAAPDQGHRHRLAEAEAVGDRPHVGVVVGLGGEGLERFPAHRQARRRPADRTSPPERAEIAGLKAR